MKPVQPVQLMMSLPHLPTNSYSWYYLLGATLFSIGFSHRNILQKESAWVRETHGQCSEGSLCAGKFGIFMDPWKFQASDIRLDFCFPAYSEHYKYQEYFQSIILYSSHIVQSIYVDFQHSILFTGSVFLLANV